MEEDTLISLSATPSYENTSPEELRWKDYEAKQAAASQVTFNMAPSSPFIVPNRCNGDAAPSNSQVFTPNSADRSTPVCKFCNNGGLLAMPSAELNSWSLGTIEGNLRTTASLLESPSPLFDPLFKATPARSPSNPASPFFGLQNQSQLVPQSPFGASSAALDLSSGVSSISTMCCPLQASSDVKAQSGKASYLEWPQSSLQAPILSMPSPLITITSSPSNATTDQNIFPQRELAPAAATENSSEVTSGMPFKFSNTESGSLVQHGISSLPDAGKYSHPRTISLLTSKQVFQKTVIRMQSRRQGSIKKDGPRVSFLNDYSDPEDSDASYVARKNPKEFLLRAPWLNNRATHIGALKGNSIKAM